MIKPGDSRRFGNVGLLRTEPAGDRSFNIVSLSDKKPGPLTANRGGSIHKGFGGGIYLPEYFELIEIIRARAKGEVDDVPIHHILISKGRLFGVLLKGTAFDAGHPLGFRAAVQYAGRPGN
jgi:UTP-glucose-1-phosphate uridylyltransferase